MNVKWLKKIACNACIIILSAVLCLLMLEFSMNFIFPEWTQAWQKQKKSQQFKNIPLNDFRMGHDQYLTKKPNTFRIVVLGDSLTWGDGIASPENIYTNVLEKRLNEIYTDINIQVINLGIRGFTTMNEVELLKNTYKLFNPDMIMLQFFPNDMEISGPNYTHLETNTQFAIKRKLIDNPILDNWLSNHSSLYSFLSYQSMRMQYKFKVPLNYAVQENYLGWIQFKKALRDLSDFSQNKGYGDPLVVIFPFFIQGHWTVETFPQKQLHQKVAMVMEENKLPVLDLLPVYLSLKKNLKEFWVSPMDVHPNQEAHLIAANAIDDFLINAKFLEKRMKRFKMHKEPQLK